MMFHKSQQEREQLLSDWRDDAEELAEAMNVEPTEDQLVMMCEDCENAYNGGFGGRDVEDDLGFPTSKEYAVDICDEHDADTESVWGDVNGVLLDIHARGERDATEKRAEYDYDHKERERR